MTEDELTAMCIQMAKEIRVTIHVKLNGVVTLRDKWSRQEVGGRELKRRLARWRL